MRQSTRHLVLSRLMSGRTAGSLLLLAGCPIGFASAQHLELDHPVLIATGAPDPTAAPGSESTAPEIHFPDKNEADPPKPHRASPIPIGDSPVLGPANAAVTLVEFCDLTASFCTRYRHTIRSLHKAFPDRLRLVHKHRPVTTGRGALLAAKAAIAAAEQGRFWEMRDRLLLMNGGSPLERADAIVLARELGLDEEQFTTDMDDPATLTLLQADIRLAEKLGVTGVPAYFLNGERVTNHAEEALRARVERALESLAKPTDAAGGYTSTASGLQYKVVSRGTGASPDGDDNVTVHYEGRLIDGTVFDSSYKRGQPMRMTVNAAIAGWTEALQLMREGAKYELRVPPELAFGEQGMGSRIGPNETLLYTIELLRVEPR